MVLILLIFTNELCKIEHTQTVCGYNHKTVWGICQVWDIGKLECIQEFCSGNDVPSLPEERA